VLQTEETAFGQKPTATKAAVLPLGGRKEAVIVLLRSGKFSMGIIYY
jgi:hypothetical protein